MNYLVNYAEILVDTALEIKENQLLFIRADVESAPLVRLVVELAYKRGAKNVKVAYSDSEIQRLDYTYKDYQTFKSIPQYIIDERMEYANLRSAQLVIESESPDIYNGLDYKKITTHMSSNKSAFSKYFKMIRSDELVWTVAVFPSKKWAKYVFPDDNDEVAYEKLMHEIINAVRANNLDSSGNWRKHIEQLTAKSYYLNSKQFKTLRFTSENTNLEVGLVNNHIWKTSFNKTNTGASFITNIPTEEIFTTPNKYEVNGTVMTTKPISYGGQVIEDIELVFEKGEIISFDAKKGRELLKEFIFSNENAQYFGEIALVSEDTPIANSNILFSNTLLDENASCHFALGNSYLNTIKNGSHLTEDEKNQQGINHSMVHEDFMFGSKDLSIIGISKNGEEEEIMREGIWTF